MVRRMQQTAVHNNAVVLSELPVERSEVSSVLAMLESEPLYMEFLMSPVIFYRKKETVEKKISKAAGLSKAMTNFLLVMIKNHNERFIPDILREYLRIEDEKAGILTAELYYVDESDLEADKKKAGASLEKLFPNARFNFVAKQDKTLIGGYLVRCKNYEIDRSYKGQLRQLQNKLYGR